MRFDRPMAYDLNLDDLSIAGAIEMDCAFRMHRICAGLQRNRIFTFS